MSSTPNTPPDQFAPAPPPVPGILITKVRVLRFFNARARGLREKIASRALLLIETFESERDRGLSLSVLADFSKDLSLSFSLFSSVCLSILPPSAEVKALSLSRARLKERERATMIRVIWFSVCRA
jgi:hypothetical protein